MDIQDSANGRKKYKGCRGSWTAKQKSIMQLYFKKNLRNKIAPRKAECLKLIQEKSDLFGDKTWVQIKTFIYNTYRLS